MGHHRPANNLLSPGSQLANDAGGDLTTDFGSAPIPKAQLLTLLATKSMALLVMAGAVAAAIASTRDRAARSRR